MDRADVRADVHDDIDDQPVTVEFEQPELEVVQQRADAEEPMGGMDIDVICGAHSEIEQSSCRTSPVRGSDKGRAPISDEGQPAGRECHDAPRHPARPKPERFGKHMDLSDVFTIDERKHLKEVDDEILAIVSSPGGCQRAY